MKDKKQRLKLIYGEEAVLKLQASKVFIAGLGGVGSYATEAIARSFINNIIIADYDIYDITNINRQLHSTEELVGSSKVDNIKHNIQIINKEANVYTIKNKLDRSNISKYITEDVDFVIDAIDDVSAKIEIIKHCSEKGIKLICCLGTGNKIYPEMLQISDIYKTSVCPLAKKIRSEVKKIGIKKLPVVFSTEIVKKNNTNIIGSTAFVPATAGLLLASYVVNKIVEKNV